MNERTRGGCRGYCSTVIITIYLPFIGARPKVTFHVDDRRSRMKLSTLDELRDIAFMAS